MYILREERLAPILYKIMASQIVCPHRYGTIILKVAYIGQGSVNEYIGSGSEIGIALAGF